MAGSGLPFRVRRVEVGLADDARWERFTDATPSSLRALRKRVSRAAERGYDTNVAEWMPDVAVVAAPVRLGERLVGTVALAATPGHFQREGEASLATAVQQAAQDIAARLGPAPHTDKNGRTT